MIRENSVLLSLPKHEALEAFRIFFCNLLVKSATCCCNIAIFKYNDANSVGLWNLFVPSKL